MHTVVNSTRSYLNRTQEGGLELPTRPAEETAAFLGTLMSTAPVGLLFVDREFRYIHINQTFAAINGPSVEEHLGRTVAEVVPALWPQIEPIYRTILDTGRPVLDVEISGETQATQGELRHWLVSFYPVCVSDAVAGIGVVAVDITERVEAASRTRTVLETTVAAVAAAVEARDPYTAGHQRRVAALAAAIAGDLGLSSSAIEGILVGATIHDIGKLAVPAEILSKPGRLTSAEFALVKEHPKVGYKIVSGIDFPWPVADMILQHHERMDGSGYPFGLAGADILLDAKIIAVADVVEAMASHRPYRPSSGANAALAQIESDRGRLLDADAVDACLRLFRDNGFSFDLAPQQ